MQAGSVKGANVDWEGGAMVASWSGGKMVRPKEIGESVPGSAFRRSGSQGGIPYRSLDPKVGYKADDPRAFCPSNMLGSIALLIIMEGAIVTE